MQKLEEFFFEDVDLSRASFLRTDLKRFQFTDVTWARKPERVLPGWAHNILVHIFRRLPAKAQKVRHLLRIQHNVLNDQLEMEPQESLSEPPLVANLYRQLRLNYEGSRQKVEAGHFYIGQMDMRRRDPDTGWFTRRLALPLYRAIAMYGESAWRPLLLYIVTSVVFAALYLYAGFSWGDQRQQVDYAWRWAGAFFPFGGDFLKAWYLALTAGSLLRGNAQVIADWGLIVAYLNMALDVFLIALFVIALRRHFRR